eukprot:4274195-Lingulodinium_polyedra.AAC.1
MSTSSNTAQCKTCKTICGNAARAFNKHGALAMMKAMAMATGMPMVTGVCCALRSEARVSHLRHSGWGP